MLSAMTYRPPYFRVDDRDELLALVAEHPLALLITAHDGDISLTHVPLLARVDGENVVLEGHIARANDQWKHEPGAAVAVFRIAAHYISPTWYPSRFADPRVVPTYDYVAIEARGPLRFIHEREWLETFTWRLSEDQERRAGGTWKPEDAPREYMDAELKAIVGLEMRVTTLEGTFKLHQHHPQENLRCIEAQLRALATPESEALAAQIERERPFDK